MGHYKICFGPLFFNMDIAKKSPVIIIESGMAIALALVLSRITIFRLSNGGEVSLEMLPLLILAVRRGAVPGIFAGAIFGGIFKFINGGIVLHPVQYLLDYPAPFALLGFSGIVSNYSFSRQRVVLAMIFAISLRLFCHWSSGVFFFSKYTPPGQPVWLYSLLYNSSYIIPSAVICIILAPAILSRLRKV